MDIILRNRRGEVVAVAIVDDDVPGVSEHSWCLMKNGYAASRINNRLTYLHRFVALAPSGYVTDHINRDKLDCRRANLRFVTEEQNHQNVPARGGTSQFRGVYWDSQKQKWCGSYGCKRRHRRFFSDELSAAAYISGWRRAHLTHSAEAV